MKLWEVKANLSDSYTTMKTPSGFKLKGTDLDNNSYRSKANGNVNRTIVGKKWKTAKITYKYLTEAEAEAITTALDYYPMYVKFKSPHDQTNGFWEGVCYCNEWELDMQRNHEDGSEWSDLTFTLVQGRKKNNQ